LTPLLSLTSPTPDGGATFFFYTSSKPVRLFYIPPLRVHLLELADLRGSPGPSAASRTSILGPSPPCFSSAVNKPTCLCLPVSYSKLSMSPFPQGRPVITGCAQGCSDLRHQFSILLIVQAQVFEALSGHSLFLSHPPQLFYLDDLVPTQLSPDGRNHRWRRQSHHFLTQARPECIFFCRYFFIRPFPSFFCPRPFLLSDLSKRTCDVGFHLSHPQGFLIGPKGSVVLPRADFDKCASNTLPHPAHELPFVVAVPFQRFTPPAICFLSFSPLFNNRLPVHVELTAFCVFS